MLNVFLSIFEHLVLAVVKTLFKVDVSLCSLL